VRDGERIFEAIDRLREEIECIWRILALAHKDHLRIEVFGYMSIQAGSSKSFKAVLTNHGVEVPLPSVPAWSADDPNAGLAPDPSAPDGSLETVSIPLTDTAAQVTVTASLVINGVTVSGSATSAITAAPDDFVLTVTEQ